MFGQFLNEAKILTDGDSNENYEPKHKKRKFENFFLANQREWN